MVWGFDRLLVLQIARQVCILFESHRLIRENLILPYFRRGVADEITLRFRQVFGALQRISPRLFDGVIGIIGAARGTGGQQ